MCSTGPAFVECRSPCWSTMVHKQEHREDLITRKPQGASSFGNTDKEEHHPLHIPAYCSNGRRLWGLMRWRGSNRDGVLKEVALIFSRCKGLGDKLVDILDWGILEQATHTSLIIHFQHCRFPAHNCTDRECKSPRTKRGMIPTKKLHTGRQGRTKKSKKKGGGTRSHRH